MSGIRFCDECQNILHPEEEKNEHRLLFVCKSCDYREYIQDTTSMEENKIYQRDFVQSFAESFIDPDYCLDPSMPREKIICPLCRYTESAYLIDKEPGDKFLRKIYICGKVNKNGRPDCRNIFSPIKYLKIVSRGETFAYREYGTADEVLVMLHGNLTSSYIFERTFAKLSEGFKVIAPDFRGFGLSSYANKLKSLDDLADDIQAFMKELKIHKFILLGWDLGAAVALKYAINYPADIEKLVLVNPIGLDGKTYVRDAEDLTPLPEWPGEADLIDKDERCGQFMNALNDRKKDFFKTYFIDEIFTKRTPENDRLDSYIENFTCQRNFPEILACLADYDISETGTGDIYKIQNQTLILSGKDDYKTPSKDALSIHKAIGGNASLKIFEDGGHVLMEDCMDEFIETVAEFCFNDQMEEEQEEQDQIEEETNE